MARSDYFWLVVVFMSLRTLSGCQDLVPRDVSSLFVPSSIDREVRGFVADLGRLLPLCLTWSGIIVEDFEPFRLFLRSVLKD